jgi:hypothetical protein
LIAASRSDAIQLANNGASDSISKGDNGGGFSTGACARVGEHVSTIPMTV